MTTFDGGASPALPPGARATAVAIAVAVADTVHAAGSGDAEALGLAFSRLATLDAEQVRLVLSGVLRPLLEDLHPDGLTGNDLRAAVEGCLHRVAGWAPAVDPQVLVVVLAGAFGVHPDDEVRPEVSAVEVSRHACLLVADLLAASGTRLRPYLDAAFVEIARAQTQEDA